MLNLNLRFQLLTIFLLSTSTYLISSSQSKCIKGCTLALASYYLQQDDQLAQISQRFNTTINNILNYNRNTIPNQNHLPSFVRINIPFSCDCINGEFLGHTFTYNFKSQDDTYETIAQKMYANLTTPDWIQRFNNYDPDSIPVNASVNVTVNCSCGDISVSKEFGLFVTYPLRPGETLDTVSSVANISSDLCNSHFTPESIHGRDEDGNYPLFKSSSGGITVGGVAVVLLLAGCFYFGFYKKKNAESSSALLTNAQVQLMPDQGMTVDTFLEFSYEELSTATDDFSLANKIGQGGFGAVYYAELRGKKAAVKEMDVIASSEFLVELNVLSHVHHQNLVPLIGYCVEDYLFLVYEYIENGNLSQHLHGSGRDPLPWSTRVQIALDIMGLEYIHEHTVPMYIHRDIKPANILIDSNFRGRVADFGITKLTEVGTNSLPTRLVGTFGYMPPEYAQYGDVSPKVDTYAFGVVLFELISAKEAIIRVNDSIAELPESKFLVALFEEVHSQPDPKDDLIKMIDPTVGDNYPLDSVYKMAQLARSCAHENPRLRPSIDLMMLSSSSEDGDIDSF